MLRRFHATSPDNLATSAAQAIAMRARPVMPMKPDLEKYRAFVDGFDLSDAEKTDLIHTVWRIMEGFVDRAFGLDPATLVANRKVASGKPKDVELTMYFSAHARTRPET